VQLLDILLVRKAKFDSRNHLLSIDISVKNLDFWKIRNTEDCFVINS